MVFSLFLIRIRGKMDLFWFCIAFFIIDALITLIKGDLIL